jgi:exopolyphosphatase / guanosine-5'-triphosphate,3'-diphosphate pyrophosphatase
MTERFLTPVVRPAACGGCAHTCARGSSAPMPVKDWRGAQVIGSGGTFTNLAGIVLAGST